MRYTLNEKNLIGILTILYLALETRFFYLIPLGNAQHLISYKVKSGIVMFVLFALAVMILLRRRLELDRFCLLMIAFGVYGLFEAGRNAITYDLNWKQVILAGTPFFLPLFYLVLNQAPDKKALADQMLRWIMICSIILSLLFLAQAILYRMSGKVFLNIVEYPTFARVEKRTFGIRLTMPGTLIIFSVLMSWGYFLLGRADRLHMVNFITGLAYIILICQTRMTTVCMAATMVLTWLFRHTEKKYDKYKVLMIFLVAVIALIAPLLLDNLTDQSSGSVFARTYAFEYFGKLFLQHPVFGIGFLPDDSTRPAVTLLLHGSRGYAKLTDIGYVGYSAQTGLVGILLFVLLVICILRYVKNTRKNVMAQSCACFLIYLLSTSTTLSVFDTQRAILIPLVLFMIRCIPLYNEEDTVHE